MVNQRGLDQIRHPSGLCEARRLVKRKIKVTDTAAELFTEYVTTEGFHNMCQMQDRVGSETAASFLWMRWFLRRPVWLERGRPHIPSIVQYKGNNILA